MTLSQEAHPRPADPLVAPKDVPGKRKLPEWAGKRRRQNTGEGVGDVGTLDGQARLRLRLRLRVCEGVGSGLVSWRDGDWFGPWEAGGELPTLAARCFRVVYTWPLLCVSLPCLAVGKVTVLRSVEGFHGGRTAGRGRAEGARGLCVVRPAVRRTVLCTLGGVPRRGGDARSAVTSAGPCRGGQR